MTVVNLLLAAGISSLSEKQALAASPADVKTAIIALGKADDWVKEHPHVSQQVRAMKLATAKANLFKTVEKNVEELYTKAMKNPKNITNAQIKAVSAGVQIIALELEDDSTFGGGVRRQQVVLLGEKIDAILLVLNKSRNEVADSKQERDSDLSKSGKSKAGFAGERFEECSVKKPGNLSRSAAENTIKIQIARQLGVNVNQIVGLQIEGKDWDAARPGASLKVVARVLYNKAGKA